ncbi:MAG TPA: hypothetical protein PLT92_14370 [Ignavibacteriaceae bacterium]|nr:hypothetical protein [Ignavibacteriaceae bacterium]
MKLSRGSFIKLGAAFCFAPFIFNLSGCASPETLTNTFRQPNQDKFDSIINSLPLYQISGVKLYKDEKCVIVPSNAIKNGGGLVGTENIEWAYVIKILSVNGKTMFQITHVKIHESNGENLLISNIEPGSQLLMNMEQIIQELDRLNHEELKSRFLKAKS